MMYEEFVKRCEARNVKEPTIDQYHDIIEPVYNYHPSLDVMFGKDRCADLYAAGGLGIFRLMREQAENAKQEEKRISELRSEFERVSKEYETALAVMKASRELIRTEWGCV